MSRTVVTRAYKLFRRLKDGSLRPLFVDRRTPIPLGVWLPAQDHSTLARRAGLAARPGWHACMEPQAPHLSTRDRVWCLVELRGAQRVERPASQGGVWYLAKALRVVEMLPEARGPVCPPG